jgi:hypothetical protein
MFLLYACDRRALLLVTLACLTFAGCGDGVRRVSLRGRVVDGGSPLNLQYGVNTVDLYFYPIDDTGSVPEGAVGYGTATDPDGTFVMGGDMGEGIPVGTYRITLMNVERTPQGEQELWQGKFDLKNTPFQVDVDGSFKQITLDVAAGTVTTS